MKDIRQMVLNPMMFPAPFIHLYCNIVDVLFGQSNMKNNKYPMIIGGDFHRFKWLKFMSLMTAAATHIAHSDTDKSEN